MLDQEQQQQAALNIQRIWRGHHDRDYTKVKHAEREQNRKEYFQRANLLEALLVIQTRVRIFLARCRFNIARRKEKESQSTVTRTLSAEERVLAAEQAALDIQRIWRGHEDRKRAQDKAAARNKQRQDHLEHANLLEAVLMLQTRARILVAKARRRIRAEALRKARVSSGSVAEAEKSANTIQRVWRGHNGRERAKTAAAERQRKRDEYFDRANLLEAVLLIQTRARIFIAKARRNIYKRTLERVSPERHLGDIEQAATNIQRIWKGHHDRQRVATLENERRRKREEYFDRANLLECVLLLQTRMRMFRDRIRLKKLKEQSIQRRRNKNPGEEDRTPSTARAEVASAITKKSASSPTFEPRPPATARSSNNNSNNTNNNDSSKYSTAFTRRSSSPYSRSANPASSWAKSSPNSNSRHSASGSVYNPPAVSHAGYFVNSYEQHVGPNVYQNMLQQQQQQQQSKGAPSSSIEDQSTNTNQQGSSSSCPSALPPSSNETNASSNNDQQQQKQQQQHTSIAEIPKYADVLSSPEASRNYIHSIFSTISPEATLSHIPKQQALYALFDCCGSEKLPVIVEVWENVTPFAKTDNVSVEQFTSILDQLRSIKVISDTKRKLELAEQQQQ